MSTPAHADAVIVRGRHDVERVLRDSEAYSSARCAGVSNGRPLRPLELDPPVHAIWRAALDPLFAPNRVGEYSRTISRLATDLIRGFAHKDEIDFAAEFSVPFPAQVLMALLGLPRDDLGWILDLKDGVIRPHRTLGMPLDDPEVIAYRDAMTAGVYEYFGAALDERELERSDDLLSRLLDLEIAGERLDRGHLLDVCFTLLVEGIDPVSAALDCLFAFLAEQPAARAEVMAAPRQALEELLRWETPVMYVARTATTDTTIGGCPVPAGKRVLALLDAANVDPVECSDAGVVRWDRKVNRHMAFGVGAHRCLGSHLARLQLSIALREWHVHIPQYSAKGRASLSFSPGVRTVDRFPMSLGGQI
jgi:cytochrome P450